MEKGKENTDRRRHRRFHAVSGVFAVNAKFGQIVDISRSGLSFRYVEKKGWPKELFERGVLFGDDDFCLDNMHIKTVSDCVLADSITTTQATIRRCGIEFCDLSSQQKSDLEYFIWANTAGEMEIDFEAN
ncbi:MAG: PilZ domain-containing protein [Proteobacteria bacterium]|nr:PilZ domain-containing protein [Pseudomonadota bacterium]MBU1708627.1 PilZ domain-containing protein [Pseudomonadota bacterium]